MVLFTVKKNQRFKRAKSREEFRITWNYEESRDINSLNFYQFRKDQNIKGIISTNKQLLRHILSEISSSKLVQKNCLYTYCCNIRRG